MGRIEALNSLAAKVDAGGDASPFAHLSNDELVMFGLDFIDEAQRAYRGSLDAAKSLHDAVLLRWDIQINTYEDDTFEASVSHPRKVETYDGVSSCMARAWLLAIIKALIDQEGQE